jgi:hypothetical protein
MVIAVRGRLRTGRAASPGAGRPHACAGGAASGDVDANSLIDLNDYRELAPCLTGPEGDVGVGCECLDFDSDSDTDLMDFAEFQTVFSGN